jgi:hypothetical protein
VIGSAALGQVAARAIATWRPSARSTVPSAPGVDHARPGGGGEGQPRDDVGVDPRRRGDELAPAQRAVAVVEAEREIEIAGREIDAAVQAIAVGGELDVAVALGVRGGGAGGQRQRDQDQRGLHRAPPSAAARVRRPTSSMRSAASHASTGAAAAGSAAASAASRSTRASAGSRC